MISDGLSPALSLPAIPRPIAARITVVLVTLLTAYPSPGWSHPLSVSQVAALADRCAPGVAPLTLAAVAYTESGFNPLALHDNRTGETLEEPNETAAVRAARRRLAAGHSLDLGLMQINSGNLAALGMTAADVFDPCRSAAAGAAILSEDYAGGATHGARQAALRAALSRYNTGDAARGFANGYVRRVELSARRVVPALDLGFAATSVVPVAPTSSGSAKRQPGSASWDVFPASTAAGGGTSTDWILHPGSAPLNPTVFAAAGSASNAAAVVATITSAHHEAP